MLKLNRTAIFIADLKQIKDRELKLIYLINTLIIVNAMINSNQKI